MAGLDEYDLVAGLELFEDERYQALHCFIDNLHDGLQAELRDMVDMSLRLPAGKYRLTLDPPSGIVRLMRDDAAIEPTPIRGEAGVAESSLRYRVNDVVAILVRNTPEDQVYRFTFCLKWSDSRWNVCTWTTPRHLMMSWFKKTLVPLDERAA